MDTINQKKIKKDNQVYEIQQDEEETKHGFEQIGIIKDLDIIVEVDNSGSKELQFEAGLEFHQPTLKRNNFSQNLGQSLPQNLKRSYSQPNEKEQQAFLKFRCMKRLIDMGFEYNLIEKNVDKILKENNQLEYDNQLEYEILCLHTINLLEEFEQKLKQTRGFENQENSIQFNLSKPLSHIQKIYSDGLQSITLVNQRSVSKSSNEDIVQVLELMHDQKVECQICTIEINKSELIKTTNVCQCQFCPICLDFYIKNAMREGRFLNLKCPNQKCGAELQNDDIKRFVDYEIFESFMKYYKIRIDGINLNIAYCPACHLQVTRSEEQRNQKLLRCQNQNCLSVMCFECKNLAHGNLSCEQNEQDRFNFMIKSFSIQKCPSCKRPIQKSSGCNHMTCSQCHYQFCWLCLYPYKSNHYNFWNVFGCPGLQSVENPSVFMRRFCNSLKTLYIILLPVVFVVFFALFHVVNPVKMACEFYFDKIKKPENIFLQFLVATILFLTFLTISFPVFLILTIIPGYYTKFYKKIVKGILRDISGDLCG